MKQISPRAHIVFDNDGTMIDSISNFFDLTQEILPKHMGRVISPEEAKEAYVPDWVQFFINLGIKEPSEVFIQGVIDDLNEANKDYVPPIISGTKDFIKSIQSHEMKTYVWTGRDEASGRKVLDALGLSELFVAMEFRDTSKAKPNPAALEIMIIRVDKEKILLIGDSEVDIKGAEAFGIKCLIVDWFNGDNHEQLLQAGAAAVVTTHEDALKFILSEY
jgi:phosphoglycolate phosphatase-like HAD superfamily hydrolase